ncbi:hypothetical protein CRENBAI_021068 [Crenichthys baileyi]|uniref:Uncharacterized protein n=1 Tax=Crenichthys baileyi TaxID=28760 RepID=A0AAV9RLD3_9TELE
MALAPGGVRVAENPPVACTMGAGASPRPQWPCQEELRRGTLSESEKGGRRRRDPQWRGAGALGVSEEPPSGGAQELKGVAETLSGVGKGLEGGKNEKVLRTGGGGSPPPRAPPPGKLTAGPVDPARAAPPAAALLGEPDKARLSPQPLEP